jgi:predicted PhzF superfamily epimerase YddE/YHI9
MPRMQAPYWQVDAFTDQLFAGNPAGVVLLEEWIPESTMGAVATENSLSETAFLVGMEGGEGEDDAAASGTRAPSGRFEIRWFTPTAEVDLCGHATLAAAFVLFHEGLVPGTRVVFESRSGELPVLRDGDWLWMDFPSRPAVPCDPPVGLVEGLGREPEECRAADRDYLAVFGSSEEVRDLRPDPGVLESLDRPGVIATAPGLEADFVSRFFAPALGVPEDPVTGSAHCTLAPYWAERLGRTELRGRQISRRGGEVACEHRGERVLIGGKAVLYLAGAATLD